MLSSLNVNCCKQFWEWSPPSYANILHKTTSHTILQEKLEEMLVSFMPVVSFPPSASYRKDTNYETLHYIISTIPLQYIIQGSKILLSTWLQIPTVLLSSCLREKTKYHTFHKQYLKINFINFNFYLKTITMVATQFKTHSVSSIWNWSTQFLAHFSFSRRGSMLKVPTCYLYVLSLLTLEPPELHAQFFFLRLRHWRPLQHHAL